MTKERESGAKEQSGIAASFGFAARGIVGSLRRERNIKIMLLAAALAVGAGFFFGLSGAEWTVVVLCCGLVLSAELFNTAVETVVDLVSPNYHELAGRAKDVAAGAVLTLSFATMVVGLVIFFPKVVDWMKATGMIGE